MISAMRQITLKTSGGTGSQLLALLFGLEAKNVLGRSFAFEHNAASTGVHYPFSLQPLLLENEIVAENKYSFDYRNLSLPNPGEHFKTGPLQRNSLSLEKILQLIRLLKIEKQLRFLFLREQIMDHNYRSIVSLPNWIVKTSGSFPVIDSTWAHVALMERFRNSQLPNPYEIDEQLSESTIIHYRIGDIRFKYRLPTVPDDGILAPENFVRLLQGYQNEKVCVVSDSPSLAKKLLAGAGLRNIKILHGKSIWHELRYMVSAQRFISSWSRVSLVAISMRSSMGKFSYYPGNNNLNQSLSSPFPNTEFYAAEYLPSNHEIYFDSTTFQKIYSEYSKNESI